jgi:hypothetical protein
LISSSARFARAISNTARPKQELVCKPCKLAFPIRDDIPVMLEDEARPLPTKTEHEAAGFQGRHSGALRLDPVAGQAAARSRRQADGRARGRTGAAVRGRGNLGGHRSPRGPRRPKAHEPAATDDAQPTIPPAPTAWPKWWSSAAGTADTIIVNVQGDEPLIEPEIILQTARQLATSGADIATVAHPIAMRPISSIRTWSRSSVAPMAMPPISRGRRFLMPAIISPAKAVARPCRPIFRPIATSGSTPTAPASCKAYAGLTAGADRTLRITGAVACALAWLPDQRDADRCGTGTWCRYARRCRQDAQTV